MLGILVAMVALGTLASCGGSSGGGGGTPTAGTTPGTYTVTVTGTSGSITQSTVLTLTVN
jgi:ABC-type glycerol-3-phosphate transport system substrate-binding protein